MVFGTQLKNERPWRLVWGNKGVVVWRFGGLTHTHRCIILLEKMEDLGDWIFEIGIYIYASSSEFLCGQ